MSIYSYNHKISIQPDSVHITHILSTQYDNDIILHTSWVFPLNMAFLSQNENSVS